MFEYTVKEGSSIRCIAMKGRIDSFSAPNIQKIFDDLILAGQHILLVDLEGVNYVSSAGLRVFIRTQKELKKIGGEVILSGIGDQVFEIFRMSGFTAVFKIISQVEDVSRFLRSGSGKEGAETAVIGEMSVEYKDTRAQCGRFISVGSQDNTENSSFTEEDVVAVMPSEMQFGCGLAALGDTWGEYKEIFGESVAVNNNFFFYPAIKHSSVDFVIDAHKDPRLTYKMLNGFGFSGEYRYVLKFFRRENGSVDLASIIQSFFAVSEANVIGIVILAVSKGLMGMHIKRTPIAEHKPANGKSIFDGENFPHWIDFPVEPSYFNHVVAATGIAVRQRESLAREKRSIISEESLFHIHGCIFDRAPIGNNVNDFDDEMRRVFNEVSLHKVQHLLGGSRFSDGMAAIIELDG